MRTLMIAGAGALLASAAMAADVKPLDAKVGLWETTTTTEMEGMPMPAAPQIPQATLDKMPAAQRAQIEAMMKNRGNLGAPRTSKSCTTKESLSKGFAMPESRGVECKRDIINSSSSKIQMHMQCTPSAGGPTSDGDVTMERIDAEHIKGNMVTKTDMQGKSVTMKMSFSSKWIAADCGDIKPYAPK